jgi:hypothetical protein
MPTVLSPSGPAKDELEGSVTMTRAVPARGSTLPTPFRPSQLDEADDLSQPSAAMANGAGAAVRPSGVNAVPGVLGVAIESPDGTIETTGQADEGFAGRAGYFVELGRRLGAELGMDGLRAAVATGPTTRIVSVVRGDGAVVHVQCARTTDVPAILRAGERQALTPGRTGEPRGGRQ